jgi:succinate dehydrogenase / fumarate reductase membrane anchor subunit
MSLRTPLAQVRGLGSAKEGVHHWWAQRLTAAALIPLTLWFVVSLLGIATADYAEAIAWVRSPLVTALLLLLIGITFHHAQLGLQVVLEDYLHPEWRKVLGIVLVRFALFALAIISMVAVLGIAFGS